MKHSRIVLAATAVAAAGALALLPSAAMGHTDNLYTWAFITGQEFEGGFATTSKTDASLAPLGENTIDIAGEVHGMEVCNEVGYAVNSPEEDDPEVLTWDHTTGAILTGPVELDLQTEEMALIEYTVELDTLADCTVIALIYFYGGDGPGDSYWAIAHIDPATGDTTVMVELPEPDAEDAEYTGLATFAGTTYVFLDINELPYVATADLVAQTVTEPVQLAGLSDFFESDGFTAGVDFDATGVLWLATGVNEEEQYHLVSFAAGADYATAAPTDIGILPYSGGEPYLINAPIPLAAEGLAAAAPEPVLAATGSEAPFGIAAGALALLVGGGAVLVLRRRAA